MGRRSRSARNVVIQSAGYNGEQYDRNWYRGCGCLPYIQPGCITKQCGYGYRPFELGIIGQPNCCFQPLGGQYYGHFKGAGPKCTY